MFTIKIVRTSQARSHIRSFILSHAIINLLEICPFQHSRRSVHFNLFLTISVRDRCILDPMDVGLVLNLLSVLLHETDYLFSVRPLKALAENLVNL